MPTEDKTALLVIDVQQGLFQKSNPIYEADALLDRINSLVDRAHHAGVPVFYVQHCDETGLVKNSEPWQLHPRLQPLESDTLLFKEKSNSFEKTSLDETLKSKDIDHVVVTGLVTHGCVKNGCLGARDLGYKVTLVKDAHSNFSPKASQLIEEWNAKLEAEGVELKSALDIAFS